jgi:methylated-DNA-[protein]-cysteine S-methyltransferase
MTDENRIIVFKYYESPVGELMLASVGDSLCMCDWRYRKMRHGIDKRIKNYFSGELVPGDSPVINAAQNELDEYFKGLRKDFSIPLILAGTDFQKEVWKVLQTVPYGSTISYKELAEKVKNSEAIRAVANANGANALSIFIPCHRIIGSSGELVGYAGGIEAKYKLLVLEGALT